MLVEQIIPGKFIIVLPDRESNLKLAQLVYEEDEHFIKDILNYNESGSAKINTHICHFSYLTISAPARDRILPPFEVEVAATYAHNVAEKQYYDNYYLYDESNLEKGIFICSSGQIRPYSGEMKKNIDSFLENKYEASVVEVKQMEE